MGFNKFNKRSFWRLDVGKITRSLTHIKCVHAVGAIYRKREAFFLGLFPKGIRPVYIKTQVD